MGVDADVIKHLPLKPDVFQILLALEAGDSHGYAILKEIGRSTAGRMRLAPSPFYRKLKRLEELGLVRAVERPAEARFDDERRRYFGLTATGLDVLRAEAARLVALAGEERVARLAHGGS